MRTRTRPEFRFRWNLGWYRFRSGTGRFGRYQTGTAIFFMLYYRFYDELPASHAPPVPWLDHVHPSSSQTVSRAPSSSLAVSRAPVQFPGCITCSRPVPRLYHVLPSSSQNASCLPPLAILGEENYLYFHCLLLLLISH